MGARVNDRTRSSEPFWVAMAVAVAMPGSCFVRRKEGRKVSHLQTLAGVFKVLKGGKFVAVCC